MNQVWDAKLGKQARPHHALQLCCYADMLDQSIYSRTDALGLHTFSASESVRAPGPGLQNPPAVWKTRYHHHHRCRHLGS